MAQRASMHRSLALTESETVDGGLVWSLLLAVRRLARDGALPRAFGLGSDGFGAPAVIERGNARALVTVDFTVAAGGRCWTAHRALTDDAASMLDLYLPMAPSGVGRPFVVGHLGVSLDGQVATDTGQSQYITGRENIVHLHRLRALADAVIVGASTVERDDPRLTTRHVAGDNPVRVVIDPGCRLGPAYRIFSDGAAETLLFCAEDRGGPRNGRHGCAQVFEIPAGANGLSLDVLLGRLRSLGFHCILVEGGGVTVSRFLEEDQLDRLQLAVAPLITGSGRPGLSLPPVGDLARALRPRCRHFAMGPDVLFDCDLRAGTS